MTEHKFTDEEVIKALHICENYAGCCSEYCPMIKDNDCRQHLMKQAKDLINRQKELLALSEKGLKLGVNISENWERAYKTAKAEAIKEFAERLKEEMKNLARMEYDCTPYFLVSNSFIDHITKELTGEGTTNNERS